MNIRFLLVVLLSCLVTVSVFAQIKSVKKFVNDGNTVASTNLTLKTDGTFKYFYSYDQIFDMGCGIYTIVKDTVTLTYQFDENDACCNVEKRKVVWSKADILNQRPERLLLKGRKLYLIENGTVRFKAKFPLRTDMNKVVIQDNYYLIEKAYAQKATWY